MDNGDGGRENLYEFAGAINEIQDESMSDISDISGIHSDVSDSSSEPDEPSEVPVFAQAFAPTSVHASTITQNT